MKMIWFHAILYISSATAAWTDSTRYASSYRFARCIPCEQRRDSSFPQSNSLEYRGNGADNLGYDWSPKAWGGRAFPSKDDEKGQFPTDDWNNRDSRRMPWNEKCRDCDKNKNWGPFGDSRGNNNHQSDRNSPTYKQDSWGASTDRPQNYAGNSGTSSDGFSTVTSSVLGVRLRDDKRLPVEWSEDGRSMRWDGFRNGMPLHRPDSMDRREDSYRPWDGSNQGSSSWNQDKKNHYASDWNYGDRNPEIYRPISFDQRPWTNRWSSNKNDGNGGQYNQGNSGYPFGSSYPQTDRYPDRPSSSYPTTTRPLSEYPAGPSSSRPGYDVSNRPTYQTTSNPYKPQSETSNWNYRPEHRPWSTSRPQQNYLPQNNRPSNSPHYSYGQTNNAGTPGTAIWNGRPYERPSDSSQRPQGFYTGFITEIHDPKYNGNGNRYPADRPASGNSYDKNNNDRFPGTGSRFPSYNGNSYPTNYDPYSNQKPGYESSYDVNRQPSYSGNRQPSYDGNKYPSYDGNRSPSYDGNRNPSYDGTRNPGYNGNRNPSYDGDRNPSYDGNRNPNYDSNKNPNYDGNKILGHGGNSNPSYDTRPNRYPEANNYDNRYPNSGYDHQNSYPGSNNNRDKDRDWNYGNDHRDYGQSSYNNDRDARPPYGSGANQYPSRPNGGDHDRGPNSGSAAGSWNYGDEDKEGSYRRSGGSYPLYKGGQYYTSSYLASASTPAAAVQDPPNNKATDETTVASSQE